MTGDLHTRLVEAVNRRRELARVVHDAEPGRWEVRLEQNTFWICDADEDRLAEIGTREDAEHIAANDPASVIRHCERDLRVLDRHRPKFHDDIEMVLCACCGWDLNGEEQADEDWCPDILDLATAYGVDTGDTDGQ